jgi:hypothetical protein
MRVQDRGGGIGAEQVPLEQPLHRLRPLVGVILLLGEPARVTAEQIVEPEPA